MTCELLHTALTVAVCPHRVLIGLPLYVCVAEIIII